MLSMNKKLILRLMYINKNYQIAHKIILICNNKFQNNKKWLKGKLNKTYKKYFKLYIVEIIL